MRAFPAQPAGRVSARTGASPAAQRSRVLDHAAPAREQPMGTPSAFVSSSGAARLARARAFAAGLPPAAELVIVGATRAAADEFARRAAAGRRATVGWHRFSLLQLASRLAAPRLAADRVSPSSALGAEAVASRAAFDAASQGRLAYFSPVVSAPGFPRALARTVAELRAAGVPVARVAQAGRAGADLAVLLESVGQQLVAASAADRAVLFATAAAALRSGGAATSATSVLLLDVPLESEAERELAAALLLRPAGGLATVPAGDPGTRQRLAASGIPVIEDGDGGAGELARLRRYLFAAERPPAGESGGAVRFFASPGEGREALDIARFALEEARRGVRFDEMAVLVRSSREYLGLLEHAFARAEIPAWFSPGTRRPHPAGRALLALLACADENLSARRFAEYLSLGQVPGRTVVPLPEPAEMPPVRQAAPADGAVPIAPKRRRKAAPAQPGLFDDPVLPADESIARTHPRADAAPAAEEAEPLRDGPAGPSRAVVEGMLRTPWRWEELLIESQVIGGAGRWRRLDGLAHEFRLRLNELIREEGIEAGPGDAGGSSRVRALQRDIESLDALRDFAMPLIDEVASWPHQAPWGEWLARLEALVPQVIRQPLLVQRVLADLRPLAGVDAVSLREVRDVLSERLRTLSVEPPPHAYGRVFIGSPDAARGRVFRVVFVPGLAERVFPQRVREDPLLDDRARAAVSPELTLQEQRVQRERLRLLLAVGAATDRLYVSYPRVDVREARPRVPSFYALDVMRAITGRLPGHDELQRQAAGVTQATLAWPAPPDAASALDEVEHDLAVLRPLLQSRDPDAVKGRAHYLLTLNDRLHRSLTERWKRWRPAWSGADGLVQAGGACGEALALQRPIARPYSVSALQRYAACPYQFLLAAIYRIAPFEVPEPLQRLDPLTRGALFHRVQAEFFRALRESGALPVTQESLPRALETLDAVFRRVSEAEREVLAPAIDRVWRDEMAALRRDLRRWLELMPERDGDWIPERFEFSFGLHDEGRDPASVGRPALIAGRFILRGSVDLVERHRKMPVLRVTDHKTGKCRVTQSLQIGGGAVLQPVLYSLAVEDVTGERVAQGRLYYCTSDGQFREQPVELFDLARRHGIEALEIIDRAVDSGFLAAAPQTGACRYCDFRPVCGPSEERRTMRKNRRDALLADLMALREMP